MSDKTELAKGFTVSDYRQAVKDQNAAAIADAIRRRFRERYLTPIKALFMTVWRSSSRSVESSFGIHQGRSA